MVAYTHYPWDPRVRREAETLVRFGHEVHVICARDADQVAEETVGGVVVHRVPLALRRGRPLRYAFQYAAFFAHAGRALRRIRRQRGLSAVHAHSLPDFIAFIGLGSRLRGVPLVLDLHEAMPEIYRARFPKAVLGPRLAVAAEQVSCLIADRVITVNETIRDLLVARGVPPERLLVVYNSPDLTAKTGEAAVLPPAEGIRLVYAGGVDPERDLATLVRALAELRKAGPASLEIYGRGPAEYRGYLEGLAEGLGVREAVRFGGLLPQERVLAHLEPADVGVVTYVRNPITEVALPNKVFEFVVLDKPLVLPSLRAMRRAFDGAALFYEPGDAVDLAAKVQVAAKGGPQIEGQRAVARTVYDAAQWDVQARRLAAAYEAIGAGA
jgi:glycosyltransferase involved in cell wall biosynthesis